MDFDLDLRVLAVITPKPCRVFMLMNEAAQRLAVFTPLCDVVAGKNSETHKIEIVEEEYDDPIDITDPVIRNMTVGELMDRKMNPNITDKEFEEIVHNVLRWIYNA